MPGVSWKQQGGQDGYHTANKGDNKQDEVKVLEGPTRYSFGFTLSKIGSWRGIVSRIIWSDWPGQFSTNVPPLGSEFILQFLTVMMDRSVYAFFYTLSTALGFVSKGRWRDTAGRTPPGPHCCLYFLLAPAAWCAGGSTSSGALAEPYTQGSSPSATRSLGHTPPPKQDAMYSRLHTHSSTPTPPPHPSPPAGAHLHLRRWFLASAATVDQLYPRQLSALSYQQP